MKTIEQLETERLSFSVGTAMTEGWAYVSKSLAYYILGGILAMIIGSACGFIPFLGLVANTLIISPCMMAGAIYVTWQISNGRPWNDFGDMFKGFNFLTQLLISALIQNVIILIITMIALMSYIPEIIQIIKLASGNGMVSNTDEIRDIVIGLFSVKTFLLVSVVCIFSLFLSTIWAFKSHFIVIYKLDAWKAMETSRKIAMRNFFELLGLFIVMGLIVVVSAVPCGIGLLFTLPWMIGTTYSAFAQITQCSNAYDIQKEGFDFLKGENAIIE